MRKSIANILLIIGLTFITPTAMAIEEVVLDINGDFTEGLSGDGVIDDSEWPFDIGGKTLQEKLQEIKSKEYKNIAKSNYLLEEILTKNFDNSIISSAHLFAYYRAGLNMDFYPDDTDTMYDLNNIDVGTANVIVVTKKLFVVIV